jgi:hypothetical protein
MPRRFRLFLSLCAGVSAAFLLIVACTTAPKSSSLNTRDDPDATTRDPLDPPVQRDAKPEEDPPLPDGGKPPGRVYAHTADTLYLLDPLAKKLQAIGKLSCFNADAGTQFDRLLDIAIDRDGLMYGTSDLGFLSINPVDATCRYIRDDALITYPNSLGFVPIGTVDQTKETLVGFQDEPGKVNHGTVYVKIDLATGAVAKVGDLNPPSAAVNYRSSGDLISLIRNGNKAYLTVKKMDVDADSLTDELAEFDPATGTIKTIIGDTHTQNIWGLGQWAGTAYGFSATGAIVEIDMTTGAAKPFIGLSGDAGDVLEWFGAGVTTDSPTKP